jgi:3-methyladenine DNA glycosylase/8-oxoguanine DNA glycosylase
MSRLLDLPETFSLEQSLRFLNGFAPAGAPPQQSSYRQAHVIHGKPLVLEVSPAGDAALAVHLHGDRVSNADLTVAERLIQRMFSLDLDGDEFYTTIGKADPVIGRLQARYPGLRPVLFASPFEALCWAIIGHRISITQAVRSKLRLIHMYGPAVSALGEKWRAFPAPEDLTELDPDRDCEAFGLPGVKIQRLAAIARRAMDGHFAPELLRGMPVDKARSWLELSPGIGPWSSEFVLIRGCGHPDLVPDGERRLLAAIQRYYALDREPRRDELARMSRKWAGFRSWAVFLLRVALQDDTQETKAVACGLTSGRQAPSSSRRSPDPRPRRPAAKRA